MPFPHFSKKASYEAETAFPISEADIREDCLNPAAEELFLKMEAQRKSQKVTVKKNETEVASKVDKSSFGLKKGFFGSSKSGSGSSSKKAEKIVEVVPKKPNEHPLQLKEVQQAMKDVQSNTSWLTPDLMKAVQMKPNIAKGMANPKIQKALEKMQKNPEAAKLEYKDDLEVLEFFKEFASLMATHFDILGKNSPKETSAATPPTQAKSPEMDEELNRIMQDREMQQLVQVLRTRPVEINAFIAKRPHLMPKVKMLIDRGMFNVST